MEAKLNGKTIWGRSGIGVESTWLRFLEHLTLSWPYLLKQEGNPWGFEEEIEDIFEMAKKVWGKKPPEEQETLDESLYFYLNTHDLGHGVSGMYVPQLFLTRAGDQFRWASIGQVAYTSVSDGTQVLETLGGCIANRLAASVRSDRVERILSSWNERNQRLSDF